MESNSSESCECSQRTTSTIEHSHEPFDTYRERVQTLCEHLWPGSTKFEIEKMRGGGYNRVIGITVHDPKENRREKRILAAAIRALSNATRRLLCKPIKEVPSIPKRYVLRIPRDEDNRVDYDCAMLRFVKKNTSISVPRIFAVDLGKNNALHERYMIQERIAGENLQDIWSTLNDLQKASAAREMGEVCRKLQLKKYDRAGQLDPKSEKEILNPIIEYSNPNEPEKEAKRGLTSLEWFRELCERQKRANGGYGSPWDEMLKVAEKIDSTTDLLKQNDFYLYHGDFETRNIMVEVVDSETVRITGVLDWDLAGFAPKLYGCIPPIGLWIRGEFDNAPKREDGNIEVDLHYVPTKSGNKAIKDAFEEGAGPSFVGLAYSDDSYMLRNMIDQLIQGVWGVSSHMEVMINLEEWYKEKHMETSDELRRLIAFWTEVEENEKEQWAPADDPEPVEFTNNSENEFLMEY